MEKIPTLYMRDPDDRRHVTSQVDPVCQWVLDGEGVATAKWDGTCVLIRRDGLAVTVFTRREVKPGSSTPPGFIYVSHDPITGKSVGWEPADQSGFARHIFRVIDRGASGDCSREWMPGTYELVGPNVNGNPHDLANDELIPHGVHTLDGFPTSFDELPAALAAIDWPVNAEGVVWWHKSDHRRAKIKRKDFA